MNPLRIETVEHGVVIPAIPADRTPAETDLRVSLGRSITLYAWPGLTRTRDGDLLVGASEHVQHVDPFGRDVIVHSTDQGRSWSSPEVFFDSVTDDRDIAFNTLPDGTVVATWFSSLAWAERRRKIMRQEWEPLRAQICPDTLRALARGWLRRSTNSGQTWEDLVYPTLVGTHAGPSPMSNGDLIYCGPYSVEDGSEMVATLSSDGGRTWRIAGKIPSPRIHDPYTNKSFSLFNENHALELAPGKILVALRGSADCKTVHVTRSNDGGGTWTEPEDLGVFGYPPYLLRLRAGPILCIFSQRSTPLRISAIVSYDDGATWDMRNVMTIFECGLEGDIEMGYPSAVELASGEIFCVFYCVPTQTVPGYEVMDPKEWGILSARVRLRMMSKEKI